MGARKLIVTGTKFGDFIVGAFFCVGRRGHALWSCYCVCGKTVEVNGADLLSGKRKSCGHNRTSSKDSLIGRTFGDWLVVGPREVRKLKSYWLCRCSCGFEKFTPTGQLVFGSSSKCRVCASRLCKRKPLGIAARNAALNAYKNSARSRGFEWGLSEAEFNDLTSSNCRYCGIGPSNVSAGVNGNFVYNGIDRVNNIIGYTKDNVVACCRICNYAKREMPLDEFIKWARRVADHSRN